MALRGAVAAALFAAAAAVPSDLNVWLADPSRPGSPPLEDQCYARTAFGTSDAAAGCGIQIAKDGVAVASNYQEEVTFIANARNALFITTNTWNDADVGSSTQMNISTTRLIYLESRKSQTEAKSTDASQTRLRHWKDKGLIQRGAEEWQ